MGSSRSHRAPKAFRKPPIQNVPISRPLLRDTGNLKLVQRALNHAEAKSLRSDPC
jgi:hypothetical protein